ncbi:hypothetical protein GOV08_01805 [Candidatus Woesearchaeota archaeon]|nr:hypothetical protein [Candidatus Woesearchaeota archaeon]
MTRLDKFKDDAQLHTYLKYKGFFDWKSLMKFMRGWIEGNHYTFMETEYKEKPDQYGIEIEWRTTNNKKIDGLYQYYIKWYLRVWDLDDVEVEENGKKVKKNQGRIRIEFDAMLEVDYEGQFESRNFFKKMEKFLADHIIKEDIESGHADALYYELNRFKNEVEAHLKMETATEGSLYHG